MERVALFPHLFQEVQLRFDRGFGPEVFRTRIEGLDEKTITVGAPMEGRGTGALSPDLRFEVMAVAEDGLHFAATYLVRVIYRADEPCLVLHRPKSEKIVQRRDHCRAECAVNLDYRMIDAPGVRTILPFQAALCKNLSGGGLLLVLPLAVPAKEHVELEIPVDTSPVRVIGKIVGERPWPRHDGRTAYGVEFLDLDEMNRERLIHFVFARAREDAFLRWRNRNWS
ncbi:MAG: PilZ domain-containing protein [Candidatus Eisenbacteria bacterium]|nr:PilZ domain-containing protein [Candidatus Eisenbacteria bacterium]